MKRNPRKKPQSGFALIVTLSLMILLTVIAVGLLSLSSISLRSTGEGGAASMARSNARLAMMLALGELQKSMGPDKSVSAPASAVFTTTKQPHITGTWTATDPNDYWHWTPSTNGSPSFSSKKDRFSSWLVSAADPREAEDFNFGGADPATGKNAVTLVGNGNNDLRDSDNVSTTVSATKVPVSSTGSQRGKYGWAVFDESTKASIDFGDDPSVQQAPGLEIATRTAPSRFRADNVDTSLDSLRVPKNLISLETASIPGGSDSQVQFRKRFHDFTTGTVGLLTNTSNGGLKTDLTSLFEPANLPSGAFTSPTVYPASFKVTSGSPRWAYLREHYRKFKNVTAVGGGEMSYSLLSGLAKDLKINGPSSTANINVGDQPGLSPSPDTERLIPVIAKFQLVFSMVTHRPSDGGRIAYWTGKFGANNFAVPHLVYDPVFTLYNPYDVTLNLAKLRVRVWDPPVGFRFTKIFNGTSAPFRDPGLSGVMPNSGGFTSLAQMQIDKQFDPSARKCFTLMLTDGLPDKAGNTLKLRPGEVKVFSARIDTGWNWGREVAGNSPHAFFDWRRDNNFGNVDFRTNNQYGVETVPGWNFQMGLQTDHLATTNPRYAPSQYSFEKGDNAQGDGFVTMQMNDQVKMECKPMVASAVAVKQFQVDILAGNNIGSTTYDDKNAGVLSDTLRSFSFTFTGTDPSADMSEDPAKPIITSVPYTVKALLQDNGDVGPAGKTPFAMLEMSARTALEKLTDNKPWLYNNAVVEGAEQNTASVGLSNQSYDLRLIKITSLTSFPNGIAVDPTSYRGYFGADGGPTYGSSFVPMLHVPVTPMASLGDLVHANLASSSILPRVVHPFGNSRAHPLISSDKISQGTAMLDHSYLLNDSLWDAYYFSTVATYDGGGAKVLPESRSIQDVLTGIMDGKKPALNSRLTSVSPGGSTDEVSKILGLSDVDRSKQLAKYIGVKGPFNVNSTSLDAWCAVLMSLRDRQVNGLSVKVSGKAPNSVTSISSTNYSNDKKTAFVRMSRPLAGAGGGGSGMQWSGFTAFSDDDIRDLAKEIIARIKERGASDSAPPFSLAEFVNRRPGSNVQATAGLLQTAIDKSKINNGALARNDSKTLSAAMITPRRKAGVQTPSVMDGNSAEGAPTMLTQGDLMTALAPVVTVRGDTFKIRSYGEATAKDGTVLARAWCETVVQRSPDFEDPADLPETALVSLKSNANIKFGRRFNIVSFRWLNESEL